MEQTKSPAQFEQEGLELKQTLAVEIVDQPTYDAAVKLRTEAVSWTKGAKEFFRPMREAAHKAWKTVCAQENAVIDPVEARIKDLNSALVRFDSEQRQKQRDEQLRLEAEARQIADAKREEHKAVLVETGMDEETAGAVADAVVVADLVSAKPTYEKSREVIYRDNYSGVVTDMGALVKFLGTKAGKPFLGLIQINSVALNAQARALKESLETAIPGVKAVNNRVIATGRG